MSAASSSASVAAGRWVASAPDPLGPNDVDPDDVRDAACSVTAPSRICDPPAPGRPDPPDVPDVGWLATIANLFVNLLLVLLVVMLVAGLAWLISRFVGGTGRVESDDHDDVADLDESVDGVLGERVVDRDNPPREWRRRADEHVTRGEFRDAIRCRYRALVGDLARAGYVDEIPGRTSGEERAQVATQVARLGDGDGARSGRITASFDAAAGAFDGAWFDDASVTAADHDRFVSAEGVVLDEVAATPGGRRRRVASGS